MNRFMSLLSCPILLLALIANPTQADGNVTIQIKNGNLQVTGQNNTTQCILVTPTGVPWQYEFSNPPTDSAGPTLFNGETSLIVSGVTGDMKFDLKSGNKLLILSNSEFGGSSMMPVFVVPRNLKISTSGSSPATVILNKVHTTNAAAEITTKNGNDAILMMDCYVDGKVKISSGGGNDVLLIDGWDTSIAYLEQCDINLGSGNDHLLMQFGVVSFQSKINLGSGNDQIAFFGSELGSASIAGGGGFDYFAETASNFVKLSMKSVEDQDSLSAFAIYGNAVNFNATFDSADNLYFALLGLN